MPDDDFPAVSPEDIEQALAAILRDHDLSVELSAIATTMQGDLYDVIYEWIEPTHSLQRFIWDHGLEPHNAVSFEVMAAVLEVRAAHFRQSAQELRNARPDA